MGSLCALQTQTTETSETHTMIPFSTRGAGAIALGLLALTPCALYAQETPANDPGDVDDELKKLRQQADDEATQDPSADGKPGSETDKLRRLADLAGDEDDPRYTELLNAFSAISNRLNAFNPRITVFGDMLGRVAASSKELVEEGVNRDDRFSLREIELDLRADIDPYAKGVLILAAEEHTPGEYEFTIEEGYLTLETLPFGLHAKAGRYRIPFGRINTLHTHDLPQSNRPYALVDFFGEEGFVDNALEVSWLTPWIPLEFYGLLLNGENDGVFAGSDSDDPAFMGRAQYFLQMTDTMFVTAGASFLFGHNDAPDPATDRPSRPSQETQVYALDVLYKWQPSQFASLVVQGEAYWLKKEVGGGARDHAFGGYVFAQVQPGLQRWFVGARYDYSNYDEGQRDRKQYAVSAYLSYYTTEFLRFRIGYEHRERSSTNGGEPDNDTVFFQLTFVFGSHPVEPFWFNR